MFEYIYAIYDKVYGKVEKPKKVGKKKLIKNYKKKAIPKAMREQVWIKNMGKVYKGKCIVNWCKNEIDVFNYHVGHNIPEVKGGKTDLTNLKPICSKCNLSMSKNYTIDEWTELSPSTTCILL
jgi:5-methylcytosine-specific restriction endonuclease McrA